MAEYRGYEYKPLDPGSYERAREKQREKDVELCAHLRHWGGVDPIYGPQAAEAIERLTRERDGLEKRVEEMAGAIIDAQRALGEVID